MLGFTTHSSTKSNLLEVHIPDELKGIELQIIILPANNEDATIDFFTDDELKQMGTIRHDSPLKDNEDYSKW